MKNLQVGCMKETPLFIAGEINQDLNGGDPIQGLEIMNFVSENIETLIDGLTRAFNDYNGKGRLDYTTAHDVAYGYLKSVIEEHIGFVDRNDQKEELSEDCTLEDNFAEYIEPQKDEWESIKESENLSVIQRYIMSSFELAEKGKDVETLARLSTAYPDLGVAFIKHIRG